MKRRSYLEQGRRTMFGRPAKKPVGPQPPLPDPKQVADFDLGSWRVRPSLGRMTRADRIVALEDVTLAVLLCLAEGPPEGTNRDALAARVFGSADEEPKLRRSLGYLRRIFSEDGSVRIENTPGDGYLLVTGAPVPGRGLRAGGDDRLIEPTTGVAAWLGRRRRRVTAIAIAAAIVFAIGTALYLMLDGTGSISLGRVQRTQAFAAEPGPERSPSFSPDGRQVVYSWRPNGAPAAKLYVRALGGTSSRALTRGDGDDVYPAWAPTGSLIAFQRVTGPQCELYVIAPDGSGEKRVADCSIDALGPIAWAREGTSLVYANRSAPIMPMQLVSLTLADGALVGVTNPVIGRPGDNLPTIASNGRRLAFQRSRAVGVADLMLLETAGGEAEPITRDGLPIAGAAWEPGSRSVVFASPRGGRDEIWRAVFDGTRPGLLAGTLQGDLRSPAVSNDGRSLIYERWRTQTRLLQVPLSADLELAPQQWTAPAALDREVQLAPDRSRVVFLSDRTGRDQIYIADTDGTNARQLTNSELDHLQSPRWTPDGRSLVVAGASGGRFAVWRVEVASGRMTRVDGDGEAQAPSVSRDGRWLYYASNRTGRWEIWRQPWPDAGKAEQLTAEGGFAAIEARDGNALYFVRPDRNGLWRRPTEPGGDDVLVTPDLYAGDWSNWLVTEDAIYFVARPDRENAQLARWSVQDEAVQRIRPLPGLHPRSGLTLTADGRGVIVAQTAKSEVDLELATLD